MFLIGADFNDFEFVHSDIILTHKLFLDELGTHPKLIKRASMGSNTLLPKIEDCEESDNLIKESRSMSTIAKKGPSDRSMIPNNRNSALFLKVLMHEESISNLEISLRKTSRILENIKEKIKMDGEVRPLRLFWVKADYKLVGSICALAGTGIAFMLSSLIKSVNFSKLI